MLRRLIRKITSSLRGTKNRPQEPAAKGHAHTPLHGAGQPARHDETRHHTAQRSAAHTADAHGRHSRGTNHGAPGAASRHSQPQRHHDRRESSGAAGVPGRHEKHTPAHRPAAAPWDPATFVVPPQEGKTRFHDFDLPEQVMHGICDAGFLYCTPIQAQALPPSLAGKDVAGQAQTGTGKTAAFLISILARFCRNIPSGQRPKGTPRALIIAPTRELVIQILEEADVLSQHCPILATAVFGGMDFEKQRRTLQDRVVDVLAATPGRLLDFCSRGQLNLREVEILVIDEADRMLDMGFIPDVKRIIRQLPTASRQTLLFSATLSPSVLRLASQWTIEPVKVAVEPEKVTVDLVDQVVYPAAAREKLSLLVSMLEGKHLSRVLVFCNRRDTADRVATDLKACGVGAGLISGAISQGTRLRMLEDFRSGAMRVLVATDVAARGIHVEDVSHVINYDVPYEPQDYVHRIGRTARVGKTGTAITFACEREAFTIPEIEKFIGCQIRTEVPDAAMLSRPVSHGHHEHRTEEYHGGRGSGRRDFRGGGRRQGSFGGRRSGRSG